MLTTLEEKLPESAANRIFPRWMTKDSQEGTPHCQRETLTDDLQPDPLLSEERPFLCTSVTLKHELPQSRLEPGRQMSSLPLEQPEDNPTTTQHNTQELGRDASQALHTTTVLGAAAKLKCLRGK